MTNDGQDLLNLGENAGGDAGAGNQPPAGEPPKNEPPKNEPPAGDKKDFASTWKDYIPEELKERPEWGNIKDVADLYKNYINSQQLISKSVRLPDANSTPEDIAKFYAKLGKPAAKTDYDFEYKPEKEGYIYNKDSFDFTVFQDIADKANLTADQYKALAKAYIDINNENYLNYNQELSQNAARELKEAENKLKMEWGSQYNSNINSITEKVKQLYPESTLKRMQNAGLFRDPEFLKSHLKLTKMMSGDTVYIEGNAVEDVPQTLASLQQKRDSLMKEDYEKNREQVLALNKQIVTLKQAQAAGQKKFAG